MQKNGDSKEEETKKTDTSFLTIGKKEKKTT